jgi:hypothetical protein
MRAPTVERCDVLRCALELHRAGSQRKQLAGSEAFIVEIEQRA